MARTPLEVSHRSAVVLLAAVDECERHLRDADTWPDQQERVLFAKLGEDDPGEWQTALAQKCDKLGDALDRAVDSGEPIADDLARVQGTNGVEFAGVTKTSVTHWLIDRATEVLVVGRFAASLVNDFHAEPPDSVARQLADLPPFDLLAVRSALDSEHIAAEKGDDASNERDQAAARLLSVFTNGLADERLGKASVVLGDEKLTVDEKLTKIDRLMPFPPTASATKLGKLLRVTKQAVMKTAWWKEHRQGEKQTEIEGRRSKHRERAKQHESKTMNDWV